MDYLKEVLRFSILVVAAWSCAVVVFLYGTS
jgi:hypothetical protein